MKKSPGIFLVLIFLAGLYGLSFAQDGKNKQKERENIELDTIIDAFFTDRKSAKRTDFFWRWLHTMPARVVWGNTESAH
jgi:hypothetical protein